MSKTFNDPLLALGRGVIWVLIVVVALIALLFAICLPLTIAMPENVSAMLLDGKVVALSPEAIGMLAAVFALGLVSLLAALYFLKQLLDIVGSVAASDPFVPANADRLSRMGWTVLGIQALAVPLGVFEYRLQDVLQMEDAIFTISFADNGLILALVLFILARVFRHGTTLRDELEGTV
jgi:hypothetical protein